MSPEFERLWDRITTLLIICTFIAFGISAFYKHSIKKNLAQTFNDLSLDGVMIKNTHIDSDTLRGEITYSGNQTPYLVVRDEYNYPVDTLQFHLSEPLSDNNNGHRYNFKLNRKYGQLVGKKFLLMVKDPV